MSDLFVATYLTAAIDHAIDLWLLPRAIRGAASARLERAVSAVHLKEGRIVGADRLAEIATFVALEAHRDHLAGRLERVVPEPLFASPPIAGATPSIATSTTTREDPRS